MVDNGDGIARLKETIPNMSFGNSKDMSDKMKFAGSVLKKLQTQCMYGGHNFSSQGFETSLCRYILLFPAFLGPFKLRNAQVFDSEAPHLTVAYYLLPIRIKIREK